LFPFFPKPPSLRFRQKEHALGVLATITGCSRKNKNKNKKLPFV
jgi:hypothetical protein